MNVGSVCTGVGGLDLGLERAGMRVAWQCEADEKCRAVLARHWPGVPCWPDLTDLCKQPAPGDPGDRSRTEQSGGRDDASPVPVDLLAGGFPCQDLSVAGARAGLAGERSALFFDLARVASTVLGPGGWLLVENVPGLLSSSRGRDFAVVLATLGELGFHDLAWRVLDSRYFDVPQRRERAFILARRSRGRCAAEVLLEPQSGGGNFEASGKTGPPVAATLSRGSSRPGVSAPGRRQEDDSNIVGALDSEGGGVDDNSAQAGHIVGPLMRGNRADDSEVGGGQFVLAEVGTLRTDGHALGLDTPEHYPLVAGTLTGEGHDASEDGTGRQTIVASTLSTNPRGGGGSNGATQAKDLIASPSPGGEGAPPGLSGRLHDPLRSLSCPVQPRPDGSRERQMGNAVTVPVAEWIGRRILDYEEGGVA